SVTVARAPSAVCASEMPSLALRIATLVPRICAFMRSAIARPAASSFDELTRRPEDRRSIDVVSDDCEVLRLRCALSETMFELMVCGMRGTPDRNEGLRQRRRDRQGRGFGLCANLEPSFRPRSREERRFDP